MCLFFCLLDWKLIGNHQKMSCFTTWSFTSSISIIVWRSSSPLSPRYATSNGPKTQGSCAEKSRIHQGIRSHIFMFHMVRHRTIMYKNKSLQNSSTYNSPKTMIVQEKNTWKNFEKILVPKPNLELSQLWFNEWHSPSKTHVSAAKVSTSAVEMPL